MSSRKQGEVSGASPPIGQTDLRNAFDLLIDQVVDYAIFVIDPEGCIATWNRGAERIKGYRADEIIGRPYRMFFTEADRVAGKPDQILARARAEGRYHEEGWRVRKDGTRFWASAVVTALRDEGGALRGYAKITRDLTERLQAEEDARRAAEERAARRQAELDEREIRRSRDQLELILRSIAEGVMVQLADGKLVFVNDAAARLCGFASAGEMLAHPHSAILGRFEILREDGTPVDAADLPARHALRGRAATALLRFRQAGTDEDRWSFVTAAPVKDADGNVEMAVSVFRELTDMKRTEQAWQFLAEASATLGASLDYNATLGQVAQLAVPRIADWCSVEILGADGTLEQLAVGHVAPSKIELAREWRRRWPPPRDSVSYQVTRSGQPVLIAEVTDAMIEAATLDPEQREMTFRLGLRSAMVVPLVVAGKPFGVVSFITAESYRRYRPQDLVMAVEIARRASLAVENARAYSEARAAIQVRDTFMSIASHELRTPLASLTILITSLVRASKQGRLAQIGAEGLASRLARAERQADQLARLVDRLLDVSRLSSGEMRLDLGESDLVELAREVLARFQDVAAGAGSRLQLDAPDAVVGRWDRSRLDQVISNLVANAIKYGASSPVEVSIAASGDEARLTVRDGGPGIASEDRDRIFGQFERAAGPGVSGMGLGLWIARRIVEAHRGALSLDSEPGRGAAFTVILPREREADR